MLISARLKLYIVLAVAFIAGALGIRSSLLQAGGDRLRAKIERDRLDATLRAMEVENEVEALDRESVRRRGKLWVRKSSR